MRHFVLALAMMYTGLGCAALPHAPFSSSDDPAVVAREHPLTCPKGARVVELKKEYDDRVERACMRDGIRQGPAISVSMMRMADRLSYERIRGSYVDGLGEGLHEEWHGAVSDEGTRNEWFMYSFLRHGEERATYAWELSITEREGSYRRSWTSPSEVRLGKGGVVIFADHERHGTRLHADMPGGTGTFRITGGNGEVRAEGACQGGLRHGAWVERDDGKLLRLRTYRAGRLEGHQVGSRERGEIRNGQRVGLWSIVTEDGCLPGGKPGECRPTRIDPAVVSVYYGDKGERTLLDVAWQAKTGKEHRPEDVFIPSATVYPNEEEYCGGLRHWSGWLP